MLVRDHTKSLQETNAIGKKLGLRLETRPNPLQQQVIALLSRMKGAQFDSIFSQLAVGDHRLQIKYAREAAVGGLAQDVRSLARKQQPTLTKHLREATRLVREGSAGGPSSSNASS